MQKEDNTPTIFTIFGITGDLAQKKLIPALLDLFVKKELPERFHIIGFARRDFSHESIRAFLKEAIEKKGHAHSAAQVEAFLQTVHYHQGTFDEDECYHALGLEFKKIEEKWGQCSNKLLYLAVPPTSYETIITHIGHAGLQKPCSEKTGWTRILIEKPFGRDVETAQQLDGLLGKVFKEEQIFRIDHYLAKETVQNILAFRFSNTLFEHLWNNDGVESVSIQVYEKQGVGTRGAFYDSVGALRDVGQNHLLQLLALVAMDAPKEFTGSSIQKERGDVLKKLSLIPNSLLRGQYVGFKEGNGVAEDSETETFFRLGAEVKNSRWRGVPFYISGGKALNASRAEIEVVFKSPKQLFFEMPEHGGCHNSVTIRIQPNEGIEVRFWVKQPGFGKSLEKQTLSFKYAESPVVAVLPDAYEQVLVDAVRGDQTLFASTTEVLNAWEFVTPILDDWGGVPLISYEDGSDPDDIMD